MYHRYFPILIFYKPPDYKFEMVFQKHIVYRVFVINIIKCAPNQEAVKTSTILINRPMGGW